MNEKKSYVAQCALQQQRAVLITFSKFSVIFFSSFISRENARICIVRSFVIYILVDKSATNEQTNEMKKKTRTHTHTTDGHSMNTITVIAEESARIKCVLLL